MSLGCYCLESGYMTIYNYSKGWEGREGSRKSENRILIIGLDTFPLELGTSLLQKNVTIGSRGLLGRRLMASAMKTPAPGKLRIPHSFLLKLYWTLAGAIQTPFQEQRTDYPLAKDGLLRNRSQSISFLQGLPQWRRITLPRTHPFQGHQHWNWSLSPSHSSHLLSPLPSLLAVTHNIKAVLPRVQHWGSPSAQFCISFAF